jgi:hypothetical protein
MPTPHHTDHPQAATPPTRRQLAYLKVLADRAGQTFTYPITREDASLQINRLKRAEPSTRTERRVERNFIADAIATGPHDSTRVRDDELAGYGSSATWAHNQETGAADAGPSAARRMTPQVGPRTELARYTVPAGERVIYGQRVDGIVRVVDRPAASGERAYLIDRGLETTSELDALIADYRATAERLQAIPMSESPVDRFLEHTGRPRASPTPS